MNYFKNEAGEVFAYDDEQVEAGFVLPSLTAMTEEEVDLHLNPPLSDDQLILLVTGSVQAHMDAAAQQAGYDNLQSAVTYAEEPAVSKFQAEGQAFRAWRSLVWARCYELLAEVQAGEREPLTAAEVLAELPALILPEAA